jgi:hypothetical protein
MDNKRKAKMFDELLAYVCEVAVSPGDFELTLNAIGFTDAEIVEILEGNV